MAQGKQKSPRVRRFSVGDKVRVKRGVFASKYADIPLGGWAGTIIEVQYSPKSRYLVEWNTKTLECIHPIYERRCERDGRKHTEMWLAHADVFRDKGGRLSIVAPKTIISAPLSKHNQEDRIRAVFGLTSDDLLPERDRSSERTYFEYLKAHLLFPFQADCWDANFSRRMFVRRVSVLSMAERCEPADFGILCLANDGKNYLEAPLADLDVDKNSPNGPLLEDYVYWLITYDAILEGFDDKEPADNGKDDWNDLNRGIRGASSPVAC